MQKFTADTRDVHTAAFAVPVFDVGERFMAALALSHCVTHKRGFLREILRRVTAKLEGTATRLAAD